MTNFVIQHNFTHGELDPRMYANSDWAPYYKCAKYLRNLYVRKQGGTKRAHGTIFVDEIANIHKFGSFVGANGEIYVLLFTDYLLSIYRQFNEYTTTLVHVIVTTIPEADISLLQTAQSNNVMVITNPNFIPKELTHNGTSDTDWTYADITFKNLPAFDFRKDYYNTIFTLSSAAVGQSRTLTASTAVFDTQHVGGLFISLGADIELGVARITGYTDPTHVTVNVVSAFDGSVVSGVSGGTSFLGEVAFSTTRLWPQSVVFYEGRLFFGGTPNLPSTEFASKVNDFSNFDQGSAQVDDAVVFPLGGNNYEEILYMVSDKSLQIFCSESEYSTMQYLDQPFSNDNNAIRVQTKKGSSYVQPQVLDDQTFYVRKGGSEIMAFRRDPSNSTYSSFSASKYSSHLINNPVSMAVLAGDKYDDSDYLFVVNSDGSMAVLQSDLADDILAWSMKFTGQDQEGSYLGSFVPNQGKFLQVVTVGNSVYCSVERIINGVTRYYFEQLSFLTTTDSSIYQVFSTPQTVIGNLGSLEGLSVKVFGDGVLLNDQTVTGAQITIETPAKIVSVGINNPVLLTPIPINLVGSGRQYLPKRIVRAIVAYYESLGIIVQGTQIPNLAFGDNVLDSVPQLESGQYQVGISGWQVNATIDITQAEPLPFNILGINYEVEI